MVNKKLWRKYAIPILALLVILIHLFCTETYQLSKWKGGGFGMYSQMHYYYQDVLIDNLNKPLDSLIAEDKNIKDMIMDVKRMPNNSTLKKMAILISRHVKGDTVKIEIWKPLIDSKKSTYSRELVLQYQFIKP